jgi:hypothetical protein
MKNDKKFKSTVAISSLPENIKTMPDEGKREFLETFLENIFSTISQETNTDIPEVEDTATPEVPDMQD